MSQKKLTFAAMAVCLAFCATAPASAAQYGGIGNSNKEQCTRQPLLPECRTQYGETGLTDKESAQVTQKVVLTALIARYADPSEGGYLTGGLDRDGNRVVEEFLSGQRSWRQAFGFAFNPNASWRAVSRDYLPLYQSHSNFFNRRMDYNTLVKFVEYQKEQNKVYEPVTTIAVLSWHSMAVAAASTIFAERVSEEVSNQLNGNVFLSMNEAYLAVGTVLSNVGEDRLNNEFLNILNQALMDSYAPLPTNKPGLNAISYPMLTHFMTGDGSVIGLGVGGWEHTKGTVMFSPGDGIINGVPEEISISSGRDSSFTTKGKGRK